MPGTYTYPGVYIEEIPSGVRTITGVATSITAFVGWAAKGPTDKAGLVLSWADFERTYGGLDRQSLLGYAVYHFFSNGGQKAYIVRLVDAATAVAGAVTLDGKLTVTAQSAGDWANEYAVVTKRRTDKPERFRLSVARISTDPKGVVVEAFDNLSMSPLDPRYVVSVLKEESNLITAVVVNNATDPPADTVLLAGAQAGEIPDSAKITQGADGNVLSPNTAAFETAMQPVAGTGGVYNLDRIDLFNILCVPGQTNTAPLTLLEKFCRDRRAFLIADCAQSASLTTLQSGPTGLTGDDSMNAAFYFPWLTAPRPAAREPPGRVPAVRICGRALRPY